MKRAFGAELYLVHVAPVSEPYHVLGAAFEEGPSLYKEDARCAKYLLEEQAELIHAHRPMLVVRDPKGAGDVRAPLWQHDESTKVTTKGED